MSLNIKKVGEYFYLVNGEYTASSFNEAVVIAYENKEKIKYKNQYLLYAMNNDIIEVRYRREGDRILLDENHSKKLKEVLINQKVPRDVRDRIPLFLYKNNIFWMYGIKKAYVPKENKNINELRQVLITVEEVMNEG